MKISLAKAVDKLGRELNEQKREKHSTALEETKVTEDQDVESDYDDLNQDLDTPETYEGIEDETQAQPADVEEILKSTAGQLETVIDDLMKINTNKEYSKAIQLLKSATRIIDDLIISDDLLD